MIVKRTKSAIGEASHKDKIHIIIIRLLLGVEFWNPKMEDKNVGDVDKHESSRELHSATVLVLPLQGVGHHQF